MARRGRSQATRKATGQRSDDEASASAGSSDAHTTPTPVVQRFYVRIENLMSQPLEVSLLNEQGSVEGLRLPPRGKSRPVESNRVGTYTRDLERQGRVRIVQDNG